jgi:GNAT superfamily N-acetyltransferase
MNNDSLRLADRVQMRTVAEDPDLPDRFQSLIDEVWPRFVTEGHNAAGQYRPDWMAVYTDWPALQFGFFDPMDDTLVACGNAMTCRLETPIDTLSDDGWDWALDLAQKQLREGTKPNLGCALSATINPHYQGAGLSSLLVHTMRELLGRHGISRMAAPVRPNRKSDYPLIPITEYSRWQTGEGLPFDPWMRVHARLGAKVVKVCPRSMTIAGTVAEWEAWCGRPIPGSGHFVLPGLLAPLQVNKATDRGVYVEPNVWMIHAW